MIYDMWQKMRDKEGNKEKDCQEKIKSFSMRRAKGPAATFANC